MSKVFFPKEASTVFDDISVNLVGKLPELINSTNDFTSSWVKFPWMITSLAKPCDTPATDKHLELLVLPQESFSLAKELTPK